MTSPATPKPASWPAYAVITLLVLSTCFPIWAAVTPGDPPTSAGILDGLLAALLFALLLLLHLRGSQPDLVARAKSYDACQYVAAVPLLLLVPFLMGYSIEWDVLLPGLAWRGWYLVMALPLIAATLQHGMRSVEARAPQKLG